MNIIQKIFLSIVLFIFGVSNSIGQYSAGGGISQLASFEESPSFFGLHAFYESPRNEVQTFFIRGTLYFPRRFFDETTVEGDPNNPPNPFVQTVDLERRTGVFSVDGGTRVYLYNTYDAGTALYGGLHLKGVLATYSERLGAYDETLYTPSNGLMPRSTSLLLAFGGNLGIKYQLPYRGALTIDFSIDLMRRMYDPASILGNEIAPLSYAINLGYRFDWF